MTDQGDLEAVYVDEKVRDYLESILRATREPEGWLAGVLESGAPEEDSGRILHIAKEHAVRAGRKYVVPDDIRDAAEDTLCLTLILNSRAEADGLQIESVVRKILDQIEVP